MSEIRTNKICIYVGKRGTGKTDLIKNLIDRFPQPKTLIVDVLDNPVWRNMKTHDHPEWENRRIPIIELEQIEYHQHGTYRAYSSNIELLENFIDQYVRDTSLIVEDCSRWYNATLTKTQKRYLLNSKQTNCDVHLFFHTLSAVPRQLIAYADYLTLFKTGEYSYDKSKYEHPDFDTAFRKVLKSTNKHETITIRLQ